MAADKRDTASIPTMRPALQELFQVVFKKRSKLADLIGTGKSYSWQTHLMGMNMLNRRICIASILVLGSIQAVFVLGCQKNKGESVGSKLQRSRELLRQNLADETVASVKRVYERIVEKLDASDEASLRTPTVAASMISRRSSGPGGLFVWWIEDSPSVDAIEVACGDTAGLVMTVPEQYRRMNDDEAKGIVVFKVYYSFEEHAELKELIQSCTERNAIHVALLRSGQRLSGGPDMMWSLDGNPIAEEKW